METTAVGFEARAEIENTISRKNPVHRFQNFVTIETESKMRKKSCIVVSNAIDVDVVVDAVVDNDNDDNVD